MQQLFYKMALAVVALSAWVVYDRWDTWTAQASIAAEEARLKTASLVQSSLPTEPPAVVKTTVYKWKDAKGNWHFGDEPGKGVKNAKKETYSNDVNVAQRVSLEEMAFLLERQKKEEEKKSSGGMLKTVVNGVAQAKATQDAMANHNGQTQKVGDSLQ